jgi:hypothetical protein
MKVAGVRRTVQLWTAYVININIRIFATISVDRIMRNRDSILSTSDFETFKNFYNAEVLH